MLEVKVRLLLKETEVNSRQTVAFLFRPKSGCGEVKTGKGRVYVRKQLVYGYNIEHFNATVHLHDIITVPVLFKTADGGPCVFETILRV